MDAGCGNGRNLKWFYQSDFHLTGIDADVDRILQAREIYPNIAENFSEGNLDSLPFGDNSFNHVICSAVLHFAHSKELFDAMFAELVRVLTPNGTLFIRVASDIGLEAKQPWVENDVSKESSSFYVT